MVDPILVDGVFEARIPASDRGLAYGDGVFRTLRVAGGQPVAWPVHMQRLAHDCARLELTQPGEELLSRDVGRLLTGEAPACVLKIMITRGSGGRGYAPPEQAASRRIVSLHPLPSHTDNRSSSLDLDYSSVSLALQPLLAGVKHLNRLEQVLARAECTRRGWVDALMCDAEGRLVATTMRNLFFCSHDGHWMTPALSRAGVAGATRQRIMQARSAQHDPILETDIQPAALKRISAVIACNSVGGVSAVSRIGNRRFSESESMAEHCRALLQNG